eukprot:TRINITY_DN25145_c0_g1_i1.p1 TRINITY_DN25145_c0_g1~~TRINITY_DN25145_c0_g1_i1.p1  ORF type:complete len:681 (+),score=91.65 TRINITY_DN25145_c0_g1_i1:55-2043(+)
MSKNLAKLVTSLPQRGAAHDTVKKAVDTVVKNAAQLSREDCQKILRSFTNLRITGKEQAAIFNRLTWTTRNGWCGPGAMTELIKLAGDGKLQSTQEIKSIATIFTLERLKRYDSIKHSVASLTNFAKMHYTITQHLHKQIVPSLTSKIEEGFSTPDDAANGVWATVKLRTVTQKILTASEAFIANTYTGKTLAMLLYSYAKAKHNLSNDSLSTISLRTKALSDSGGLKPLDIAHCSYALAVYKIDQIDATLRSLINAAKRAVFTPQGISMVVWALATLRHIHQNDFLVLSRDKLPPVVEKLSVTAMVNIVWGFCVIKLGVGGEVTALVRRLVEKQNFDALKPEEMVSLIGGFSAKPMTRPLPQQAKTLTRLITQRIAAKPDVLNTVSPQGLTRVSQSLVSLKLTSHAAFERIAVRFSKFTSVNNFPMQLLPKILMSFSSVRVGTDLILQSVKQLLIHGVEWDWSVDEKTMVLYSVARLGDRGGIGGAILLDLKQTACGTPASSRQIAYTCYSMARMRADENEFFGSLVEKLLSLQSHETEHRHVSSVATALSRVRFADVPTLFRLMRYTIANASIFQASSAVDSLTSFTVLSLLNSALLSALFPDPHGLEPLQITKLLWCCKQARDTTRIKEMAGRFTVILQDGGFTEAQEKECKAALKLLE